MIAEEVMDQRLELIVRGVEQHGYAVCEQFLPDAVTADLLEQIRNLDESAFRVAGVGRGELFQINARIRRDRVCWIDEEGGALAPFFVEIARLQQALNRYLYLGLSDFECHWAYYPAGGFYRRHVDAFVGQANRRLSAVLYLNPDWQPDSGGELVLYRDESEVELVRIPPRQGTLVVFLSEEFPHEVLPTLQPRYSVTGWFRVQESRDSLVNRRR